MVRWRLIDLAQWIFEEFRITICQVSRELRALGYRKLSARPRQWQYNARDNKIHENIYSPNFSAGRRGPCVPE